MSATDSLPLLEAFAESAKDSARRLAEAAASDRRWVEEYRHRAETRERASAGCNGAAAGYAFRAAELRYDANGGRL